MMVIPLTAFAETKPEVAAGMEVKAAACYDCAGSVSATDARQAKASATRARRAKSIGDWFKFAFDKDDSVKSKKFDVWQGPSRAERIENRSQWLDFAFDRGE